MKCASNRRKIGDQSRELTRARLGAVNAIAIDFFVQGMARGRLEAEPREERGRTRERENARDATAFRTGERRLDQPRTESAAGFRGRYRE